MVVEGSERNCRMRRTVIAGMLLAGCATAAVAADPAAGQKIFKAQCAISVPGFNYTADHKKLGIT